MMEFSKEDMQTLSDILRDSQSEDSIRLGESCMNDTVLSPMILLLSKRHISGAFELTYSGSAGHNAMAPKRRQAQHSEMKKCGDNHDSHFVRQNSSNAPNGRKCRSHRLRSRA